MYLWVVIIGGFGAVIAAMGIGSNDAANAFATSVGSKALTIKQASGLAVVFESAGAILMGSHVTNTIRKGISDYSCFEDDPELLAYGCMWVIISVATWLFTASYLEMPVSTTHSCVGGMIGMTIALKGTQCVIWAKEVTTFPYVGGVAGIVLSWFISPIFSSIIASFIYLLNRTLVLRRPFDSKMLIVVYPSLVGFTLVINSFFIIYKGAKGLGLNKIDVGQAFAISFGIGSVGALITVPFIPYIKNYVNKKISNNTNIEEISTTIENNQQDYNINSEAELKTVLEIHDNAEKFDPKIEETYKYLQVFSAICDSFSHGANDVANAIGPFAAIYVIYRDNGVITKKNDLGDDAYWILAGGGLGIALGLLIYGKKIIHALGEKLCKITPSRGTCVELGSALVIITGSRLKIPLSTTHCQVGAECGVALCEKHWKTAINKKILLKTVFGWIITCIFVGILSGILTAQGAYSNQPKVLFLNNTNYTCS
jgi:sodium-dependent phosphate transporter